MCLAGVGRSILFFVADNENKRRPTTAPSNLPLSAVVLIVSNNEASLSGLPFFTDCFYKLFSDQTRPGVGVSPGEYSIYHVLVHETSRRMITTAPPKLESCFCFLLHLFP